MHSVDGTLLFSATDLTDFLACEHLTRLELAAARGEITRPARHDPGLELITQRGLEHEKRYLAGLKAQGLGVAETPWLGSDPESLGLAHAATLDALRSGVDVVYQAAFFDGRWRGYADFLFRVEAPSQLGSFSYEVADTKLARRVRVAALLQMCHYAQHLDRVQGREPERIHLILGTGERHPYRLRDFSAYERHTRRRFEAFVDGPPPPTYPHPVEHCGVCAWADVCSEKRTADDHLSQVAGIQRQQVRRLEASGITTIEQLADAEHRVPGIGTATFDRLRQQARLQVHQRANGSVKYELLPPAPNQGLSLLPPPSPGDLFFDMEGDPYVEDGGLEYLFGVLEGSHSERSEESLAPRAHAPSTPPRPRYHAFWAHDRQQEKHAFEAFIDFVVERLDRDPSLHVYHYAPYEPTAIKRLMGTHATREAEVDRLLRGGVLVDLYQVVRQGLRISQDSYSIKKLEPLYMPARDGEIKDAGSSMVAYEQWLQNEDPTILGAIHAYNEDDCISTWHLRDWLEGLREELARATGTVLTRPEPRSVEPTEAQTEAQLRVEALMQALAADVPGDPAVRTPEQQARWLLAQLLSWHRREEKPEWWAYFERLRLTDEELHDDAEAIAGLEYVGEQAQVARSAIHRYRFDPAQEHKLPLGVSPHDPRTGKSAGEIVHVDPARGYLDLKRGRSSAVPHPSALVPPPPIDTRVLRQSLERLAAYVVEHPESLGPRPPDLSPAPYRAALDLLLRAPPRLIGHPAGTALVEPEAPSPPGRGQGVTAAPSSSPCPKPPTPAEAARRLVHLLDDSCLPIQGPPGSGKTYTGARMVVDLVRQGMRVGIAGFSHKAIGNLLDTVAQHAYDGGVPLEALQKASDEERCSSPLVQATTDNAEIEKALAEGTVDVIAGTPWLFARPVFSKPHLPPGEGGGEGRPAVSRHASPALDYLFVDEAGQLSLANTLAIAGAARSLVLLGDPQQLSQPSKGSHPPGAEVSALQHVLGQGATVAPERGILLDTTWRMHPAVCAFVSDVAYDGRLRTHPTCAAQTLADGDPLGGVGLRYLPIQHQGNRTSSLEEAAEVARCVEALVGRRWVDRHGQTHTLTLDDVLVVAPYNAHAVLVGTHLPEGARIGTVDRFQGQEAPVVLFTTAASSTDDLPRGVEFLLSLNRLNVAVSRARGLAALVASPELLAVRCHTPEQMKLANAFCRLVEVAEIARPRQRDGEPVSVP